MSDTSQGEGWWQASDLKWYPPELHANADHRDHYPPTAPPATPRGAAPRVAPSPPVVAPEPRAPAPFPSIEAPTRPPTAPTAVRSGGAPAPDSASARGRPVIVSANNGGPLSSVWVWAISLAVLVGMVAVAGMLALTSGDDDSSASATGPTPGAPEASAPPADPSPPANNLDVTEGSTIGSIDAPAAFGQVWGWPQWRASIVEVTDTAGTDIVDPTQDPPPPGRTHLIVVYEATYLGPQISAFEPFLIDSPSATVYDSYACFIEPEELEKMGVDYNRFELVPGQTARFAECIEVSTTEVRGITLSLDNVNQFAQAVVFTENGGVLPDLEAPTVTAGAGSWPTSAWGTEMRTDDWAASVNDVFDASEAGVVASFADPPSDGSVYLVVSFVTTYLGDEPNDFVPLRVTGIGTEVYEPINSCWLDPDAMAARGIETGRFELGPQETAVLGACLEVPAAEVDSLVIRLKDGFSFDDGGVLYGAVQ